MNSRLPVPRKLHRLRRSLAVVGVAIVLLVAALVIGAHHLEGLLLHAMTARTGRAIRVDGMFEAHLLSLHPRITASQVSIGNPPWMPAGVTAQVGTLTLFLQWQASVRPLAIRRLEIEKATLHLARDSFGRANWRMREEGAGAGPPLIRSLSMPNAQVELHDDRRHLQFKGTVSAADASDGTAAPPLRIDGAGQLNGRAVSFAVTGDPLATVRRDHPYDFALEEHSSANGLAFHGAITQPFDFRALQGNFDASGPDLKDLYFLVGLGLPDTAPYRLSGRLSRQGSRFVFSDLAVKFGESDVRGTLATVQSHERSTVEGELNSESLRLSDIGARAAGRSAESSEATGLRFSQTPFRLSGMQRTDALVRFHLRALGLGRQSLRSMTGVLSIDHGVLSINLSRASLGDGTLSGTARFDATREVPRGQVNLSVTDLPLEQFKGKSSGEPPFLGSLSGRVRLNGEGKSPHELAATANGTITAVVPHGAMRASIADLVGLDVTAALGAAVKDQKETAVRCGVASFDAHDGLVTTRIFVLDTDKVLITATGDVHMDSETLDLSLHGRPKRAGLALRSAMSIEGTLAHPQFRLAGHGALAQTGAAVALGVILTPVAAILAFVDPGLTRNADCASLIALAKAPAGTAAQHADPAAK